MSSALERLQNRQNGGGSVIDALMSSPLPPQIKVVDISIDLLLPYPGHTFKARPMNSEYMLSMLDSVRKNGILEPLIIRPAPEAAGKYEIIAGHTRCRIAKAAGLTSVPCVIKQLDDLQATIEMGETNVQRPDWLPSEKAMTYSAHLLAISSQRTAVEPGSTAVLTGKSRDIAASRWGISGRMLDMYVRLAALNKRLLDLVDSNQIAVKAGAELTRLNSAEQDCLAQLLESNPKVKISVPKAHDLAVMGKDMFPRILGLTEDKSSQEKKTVKVPVIKSLLCKEARNYLEDIELAERIANVINAYVREMEETTMKSKNMKTK